MLRYHAAVISGLLALVAAAPAWSQGQPEPVPLSWVDKLGECQSEERSGADRIARCTEIIDAKQVNAEMRGEAYLNRAAVHMSEGRAASAIADLTRAIELNGDYAALYALRADAAQVSGDLDRAVTDLDKALSLDAENAEHLAARGALHARRKDFEKAMSNFRAALALDADNAIALDGIRALEVQ